MVQGFENILTVDVEDWYHILEVKDGFVRNEWDGLESRVVANTERLLELFAEASCLATFFVVGWIASRQPGLIRRISEAGHELGCHSFWHELIGHHTRASLAADLEYAKKLVEDLSGTAVLGFRAPGGSITPETAWALEVVAEQGFAYDSSLCPGYSSHGGFASPYFGPHRIRCTAGELVEIPTSTTGVGRYRMPYAGGGYLRLLPLPLLQLAIALDNRAGRPANLYVHPREIDPEQPRMALPLKRRFKYYVGLSSTERKIRSLLRTHRFQPAGQWIADHDEVTRGRVLDVRHLSSVGPSPRAALVPPPPSESVSAANDGL